MDYKCEKRTLSIVTPTFNRADTLKRSFDSLCRQTCLDFEWIVVDDGSSDNTKDVVKGFKSDFPIIYIRKENGGKHTALNAAHSSIHGEYVLILDSDDYLIDSAVLKILKAWEKYDSIEKIGIVIFLKGKSVEIPSCKAKDSDEGKPVDIMRYKRECISSNDCCEVIRAELFKKYAFPVFDGEKFISEGALWNRVSFTHKCVYINQVVYIAEYLDGGLTKSGRKLRIHNPLGGMYTANLNMDKKNYLSRRFKNGLLFTSYGFFANKTPLQMASETKSLVIMWLCLAPGWFLYKYWGFKYQ